jgi:hypothetical protein
MLVFHTKKKYIDMTSTNNDLRLNLLLKDFPLHTLGKVLAICTLLKYIDS